MNATLADPVEILGPYGDAIPLSVIGDSVGMSRATRDNAVRKGWIQPLTGAGIPERGHGRRVLISRDEARLIFSAAVIATALGVGIALVIRGLRNTGVTITADAVTIPLTGLSASGVSA